MYGCGACMPTYASCECLLDLLGIWEAVSHHVDAGNHTWVLCRTASALNRLALPSTKEGFDIHRCKFWNTTACRENCYIEPPQTPVRQIPCFPIYKYYWDKIHIDNSPTELRDSTALSILSWVTCITIANFKTFILPLYDLLSALPDSLFSCLPKVTREEFYVYCLFWASHVYGVMECLILYDWLLLWGHWFQGHLCYNMHLSFTLLGVK